jgi:hypothetical protein
MVRILLYTPVGGGSCSRGGMFSHLPLIIFFPVKTTFFSALVGKKEPHIGVLAGFVGTPWDKVRGKKQLDPIGFTDHQVRCKPAVFRLTGR